MDSQQVIPADVWDQDVAFGGVVDGQLPPAAMPVVAEGVVFTREVPTMAATFGLLTIRQADPTPQRIGRNGRRRRLLISVRPNVVTTAYVVMAENAQQAAGGYGLPILQGSPVITLNYAGELFFAAFGADVAVGFISELDQG